MNKIKYLSIVLIAIGLIIKFSLKDFFYIDYTTCLRPWIGYMNEHGFVAFKEAFYNYTPAYIYGLFFIGKLGVNSLYGIKIFSIIFEYITAFFIGKAIQIKTKSENSVWLAMGIVPLIPTVMLNSSVMCQCDAVYAAFVAGSVFFALKSKQLPAVILLGIAFAIKAQTIMIFPFYFVLMLRGNIKWYYFLMIPLVYFITILPCWIVGRPLMELLLINNSKNLYEVNLVSLFPNIYHYIPYIYQGSSRIPGALFVAFITILGGFLLKNKKYSFSYDSLVKLMFLSVIVCPFFLPCMLERYMFLGDVLGIIYLFTVRKKWYLPVTIILLSFYSYVITLRANADYPIFDINDPMTNYVTDSTLNFWIATHTFSRIVPWKLMVIVYFVVVVIVTVDFMKTLKKNKPEDEFLLKA